MDHLEEIKENIFPKTIVEEMSSEKRLVKKVVCSESKMFGRELMKGEDLDYWRKKITIARPLFRGKRNYVWILLPTGGDCKFSNAVNGIINIVLEKSGEVIVTGRSSLDNYGKLALINRYWKR